MKNIYFTPGPSQIYPKAIEYLYQAIKDEILSLSHRSEKFEEIYKETIDGIKELLSVPNSYHIVFLSSATEAMERTIQNTVYKSSYHIVTGAFGKKLFEITRELDKKAVKLEIEMNTKFPQIEIPNETELICITENETSNGFSFPKELIYRLKVNNPDKLIALDIVSSAPYVNLDFNMLDLAFFSVQKCFGLPAGLAVLIFSPQALEKSKHLQNRGVSIGSYHNFINLVSFGNVFQTYETPNVLDIYLLKLVLKDMNKTGIEKIRSNIKTNSLMIYNFAEENSLNPYIKLKEFRSDTVIVLESERASHIVRKLKDKRIVIDDGYGDLKDKTIRIANFPAHTEEDFKHLIKAMKPQLPL